MTLNTVACMCLELLCEDWGPLRPRVNPWHPSLLFNSDALTCHENLINTIFRWIVKPVIKVVSDCSQILLLFLLWAFNYSNIHRERPCCGILHARLFLNNCEVIDIIFIKSVSDETWTAKDWWLAKTFRIRHWAGLWAGLVGPPEDKY